MLRRHILAPLLAGAFSSVAHASDVRALTRVFVDLPERYVAHVTKADRRWWLQEVRVFDDPYHNIVDGQNLRFSYDGEEPMSGNAPFELHVFRSPPGTRIVGTALQRYGDAAVHILRRRGSGWVEITRDVLPREVNPKLYYAFSERDDVISVSDYVLTRLHSYDREPYPYPSKLLERWRWTGEKFAVMR